MKKYVKSTKKYEKVQKKYEIIINAIKIYLISALGSDYGMVHRVASNSEKHRYRESPRGDFVTRASAYTSCMVWPKGSERWHPIRRAISLQDDMLSPGSNTISANSFSQISFFRND